ncbi:hypothetical protein FIBSPDRAFT_1049165 [Athelia psychrophila]|uniref:Uncharacterized protein n=1 Tax=Athelia psychrophila TaxID=1759441 RepID=A0A166CL72_9AGAM|nr:hypothetical protein FIBSPDRAFT_1049165 [Fibularhizoctonia sp. CBS 109695]
MVAILVARFEPTIAGSYGGFIALIVCLCSILAAVLGVGVYYLVRTPADPHAHRTVSVSTSSLTNTPSPPPPHPQSPPQSQGRWLGLLPLSFRSKPSGDAECALGVQSTRPQIWRKGSEGKPVWMQASGDEWDTEDGYSQKTTSTQAAPGERAMRMAQRDSLAKSDFESISEEAADALQALPAAAKIARGPGSGSSSSTASTYYSRNRSKSPPGSGAGSLQRQMQMNSIESVRSLNTSPEPYTSTDDQHSQAELVRDEASEVEGNGPSSRDSEGSVSTRTLFTGTKFVEALDDI